MGWYFDSDMYKDDIMNPTIDESIKMFEEKYEDKVTEIILLGKNGSISRLIMEEKENEANYFG